jgi:hypothetical protein
MKAFPFDPNNGTMIHDMDYHTCASTVQFPSGNFSWDEVSRRCGPVLNQEYRCMFGPDRHSPLKWTGCRWKEGAASTSFCHPGAAGPMASQKIPRPERLPEAIRYLRCLRKG